MLLVHQTLACAAMCGGISAPLPLPSPLLPSPPLSSAPLPSPPLPSPLLCSPPLYFPSPPLYCPSPSTGLSVEVYQLPISQWLADVHSSLTRHRDSLAVELEGRPEDGNESAAGGTAPPPASYQPPDPSSFAKPTFVRKLSPPLPLQPCSESDPAFALAELVRCLRVCACDLQNVPTCSNQISNQLCTIVTCLIINSV